MGRMFLLYISFQFISAKKSTINCCIPWFKVFLFWDFYSMSIRSFFILTFELFIYKSPFHHFLFSLFFSQCQLLSLLFPVTPWFVLIYFFFSISNSFFYEFYVIWVFPVLSFLLFHTLFILYNVLVHFKVILHYCLSLSLCLCLLHLSNFFILQVMYFWYKQFMGFAQQRKQMKDQILSDRT